MASHLIINKEDQTDNIFRASVYGLGGITQEHSDAYGVKSGERFSNQYVEIYSTVDIIATMMLHITDVSVGGGT